MFKRVFLTSLAGLLVLTACTGTTPTATPDTTKVPGHAAARIEGGGWGYGSGGLSQQDSGFVATASSDSSTTSRGGGAIGSGN